MANPILQGHQSTNLSSTKLRVLIGCGDQIGLFTLPFLFFGLAMNALRPAWFTVGGPPTFLKVLSVTVLIIGITNWLWSVALILTKVPRGELITNGPFGVIKHPLYTGVAFLVAPWLGFLLDTWLGAVIGLVLYIGSRLYSPLEERTLALQFGVAWDEYEKKVRLPWV